MSQNSTKLDRSQHRYQMWFGKSQKWQTAQYEWSRVKRSQLVCFSKSNPSFTNHLYNALWNPIFVLRWDFPERKILTPRQSKLTKITNITFTLCFFFPFLCNLVLSCLNAFVPNRSQITNNFCDKRSGITLHLCQKWERWDVCRTPTGPTLKRQRRRRGDCRWRPWDC